MEVIDYLESLYVRELLLFVFLFLCFYNSSLEFIGYLLREKKILSGSKLSSFREVFLFIYFFLVMFFSIFICFIISNKEIIEDYSFVINFLSTHNTHIHTRTLLMSAACPALFESRYNLVIFTCRTFLT